MKLRRYDNWKNAKPTFRCGLWHVTYMTKCLTMLAYWIKICGGELNSEWVLCFCVLGRFLVQEASIDHQSERKTL